MTTPKPLLDIENLQVTFSTRRGPVEAVRGISLSLAEGETLGIVGESGSGKSVTGFAMTRLLDASGKISGGRISFRDRDITKMTSASLREMHGSAMAMIFQNPRGALNPIRAIGQQIADAILAHRKISASEARAQSLELLRAVKIRDPEKRMNAYPHELSGGMCQRVMIAMAISSNPALLIADEPTTGLDVTTQKVVMDLLASIAAERGMATILITHDLGLAARYCRRVVVMEQGKLVEEADALTLFRSPQHPYTKRLVAASPTATSRVEDLVTDDEKLLVPAVPCSAAKAGAWHAAAAGSSRSRQTFRRRHCWRREFLDGRLRLAKASDWSARSGSGKSTTSRMICRLLDQTEGTINFNGQSISHIPGAQTSTARRSAARSRSSSRTRTTASIRASTPSTVSRIR